jgi:hypothetical protein
VKEDAVAEEWKAVGCQPTVDMAAQKIDFLRDHREI